MFKLYKAFNFPFQFYIIQNSNIVKVSSAEEKQTVEDS